MHMLCQLSAAIAPATAAVGAGAAAAATLQLISPWVFVVAAYPLLLPPLLLASPPLPTAAVAATAACRCSRRHCCLPLLGRCCTESARGSASAAACHGRCLPLLPPAAVAMHAKPSCSFRLILCCLWAKAVGRQWVECWGCRRCRRPHGA